ncbi:MAG: hypothetical protein WAU39_10935 [Polyangiales bacterium]
MRNEYAKHVQTIEGEPSVEYRNIDGTGKHPVHFELGDAAGGLDLVSLKSAARRWQT